MIKILLVEDEPEILELLEMFTLTYCPEAKVFLAKDGLDALDILRKDEDINLIISDYNMPNLNGGGLYLEYEKLSHRAKFCICSARQISEMPEFSDNHPFSIIQKTKLSTEIKILIEQLVVDVPLSTSSTPMNAYNQIHYRQIRTHFLHSLGVCPVDLFISLSEEKKIKILSQDDIFSEQDYDKYRLKNINTFFYQLQDFSILAPFLEKALGHLLSGNQISNQTEYLVKMEYGLELIRLPFMSDEQIALAQKWMNSTMAFASKCTQGKLSDRLAEILKLKSPWYSKHIALTAFFATDIACALTLNSEQTMLKLNMAALIHDIELKEDNDELSHLTGGAKKLSHSYKDHPRAAVEQFPKLKINLPDVDKIVRDHHELPDGTGFPRALKGEQINHLSAIFILAHSLACICLKLNQTENINRVSIIQELPLSFQTHNPFKDIIHAWIIS